MKSLSHQILILSILIITILLSLNDNFNFLSSFRNIVFNVTSILTGTGYATAAYDEWGTPAIIVFLSASSFLISLINIHLFSDFLASHLFYQLVCLDCQGINRIMFWYLFSHPIIFQKT